MTAILIGCWEYNDLKLQETKGTFKDLPGIQEDLKKMKELLEELGFEVKVFEHPEASTLKRLFIEIDEGHHEKNRGKELLKVYFSGHGV